MAATDRQTDLAESMSSPPPAREDIAAPAPGTLTKSAALTQPEDESMQVRSDREWENADNDDFDRRDARDSYERRDYDDARMDYDRRDVPPPREDRGRGRPSAPQRGGAVPKPDPSNIIGAFGLSIRTTERDLEDEFNKAGPVERVVIVYDARTGRSRGFAFITMRDVDAAAEAVKMFNGFDLHGRRMRVDYSTTTRAHEPTPGEYRGNPRPADDRMPPRSSNYRGGAYGDRRDRDDRDRDYSYRPRGGDSWRSGRDDAYRGDSYRGDSYRGDRGDSYRGDSYRGDSYRGDSYRGDSYRGDSYRGDSYRGDSYRGDSYRGDSYRGDSYRGDSRRDPYDGDRYASAPRRDRAPPRYRESSTADASSDWRRRASPPAERQRSRSPTRGGRDMDDYGDRGSYGDERYSERPRDDY